MICPAKTPVTSPFNDASPPYDANNRHRGVDFASNSDNTIYAPFSGKVTLKANNGNDGNGIYMVDPQGRFHGLLHASKYLVENGATVQEGQPIAIMGATGYAFGVHLHWAVKENGVFIDPLSLIPNHNTQGGTMATSAGLVRNMYRYVGGREASDQDVAFHTQNSTPESLMDGFIRNNDLALVEARKVIDRLNAMVTAKDAEIASLKAQLANRPTTPTAPPNPQDAADATQWRQYRNLIKELLK